MPASDMLWSKKDAWKWEREPWRWGCWYNFNRMVSLEPPRRRWHLREVLEEV